MRIPGPATENLNWHSIIRAVGASEPEAVAALYGAFNWLRFYFSRHIGPQEAEDLYHQLIVDLVQQIRRDCVREPERLPGYVQAMAHRKLCEAIRRATSTRQTHSSLESRPGLRGLDADPETEAIRNQHNEIALRLLKSLRPRDREVLVRFYFHGHAPARIQQDLGLTTTQFRLIKSRAKARFVELCRARILPKPARSHCLAQPPAGLTFTILPLLGAEHDA